MSTTPPDDVAAMFDLPPSEQPAGSSLDAEEAALAAELAAELACGDFADDAPDSRTRMRVAVAWPACVQLPEGRVVALEVRNVSEAGVGLMSAELIPAHTVVRLEMDVPPLVAGGAVTRVAGTIRTTYTVTQGASILFGGTWQEPPADLALVDAWIAHLRA